MLYQLSYASPTTTKHCRETPGNPRTHSGSAHNTAQFLRLAHRKRAGKRPYHQSSAGVYAREGVVQNRSPQVPNCGVGRFSVRCHCRATWHRRILVDLNGQSSSLRDCPIGEGTFTVSESATPAFFSFSQGDPHESNFARIGFGFVLFSRLFSASSSTRINIFRSNSTGESGSTAAPAHASGRHAGKAPPKPVDFVCRSKGWSGGPIRGG
jgi:hypothetical protein